MCARHTHAESQSGGGSGEASAPPLTLAGLETVLRPFSKGLDELRSMASATNKNVAELRSMASVTNKNVAELRSMASATNESVAALRSMASATNENVAELRSMASATNENVAELRSMASATNENVAALVEVAAGAAVASEWSRARVNSLSELCTLLLAHEEDGDESRAVVRLLCASLAPDVRAPLPAVRGVPSRDAYAVSPPAQVWRCLCRMMHKLYASFLELQRSGALAEPLCDDTLDLRHRLDGAEPDWACLQQLAWLCEARRSAPKRADEACVAGAVRRFAAEMAAAGTLSAAAGEQLAARLLQEGDGRMRSAGPSLAFVVATAQLCDAPLFELDFDGVGALSYCADTCVLNAALMEVKSAPTKGALVAAALLLRDTLLTRLLLRAAAAADAVRHLRRRAAAACAVFLAAARCEDSPWAGLRSIVVDGTVALLRPLREQQLARLHADHAHALLQLPAAGAVECSMLVSFWVVGNKKRNSKMVAR